MAINVNTVYNTVLSILNKEQRGYITPDEFNKLATQVQLEVFENYFEDMNQQLRVPQTTNEYANRQKNVDDCISIFKTIASPTLVGVGSVLSASVTAGGTGYIQRENVATTGGTGSSLTLNTFINNPTFSITTQGTGYFNSTNLSTTVSPAGGTGLTVDITSVSSTGQIQGVNINNPGFGYTATNVPPAQVAAAAQTQSYTISDLEMLLLQVQPPQAYIEGMMKQIQSGSGLNIDYRTHSLYRFNLNTINGLTNQLIPASQQRAYSIFSLPLGQNSQLDITQSAFQGAVDGCQNYQYVFGGSLIPDRPIDLFRYTQNPARTDALHLVELEKALINANYGVRNLLRVPSKFLIGRAFSKYGQIFNLQNESLSLRVEYQGATQQKLFEHFVCYLKRINISQQGVQALS